MGVCLGDRDGWAAAIAHAARHRLLALSVSLLPDLSWLPGVSMQLAVQLLFTAGFVIYPEYGVNAFLLPLGLWVSLSFLALMAAVYVRRVDLTKGEVHCLRFEAAELQNQVADAHGQLAQAEERHHSLEAELAEILNLAEDANRTKTEFLATMSHEIRTPLNGILPILEMLRDTPLNREQQSWCAPRRVRRGTCCASSTTSSTSPKVESGKLQLESIEIDVRDLVGSVTGADERQCAQSQPEAECECRRERASRGAWRPDPPAADPDQPGEQRDQVHRGRWHPGGGVTWPDQPEGGRAVVCGGRHRHRYVDGDRRSSVSVVHPGGCLDHAQTWRHRSRAGHLQASGRTDGRQDRCALDPGQGSTFWFLVPLRKSVMEVPSARRNLQGCVSLP